MALQDRGVSPQVTYEGRSVMVIPNNESGGYLAIVGIAQKSNPGTHTLQVNYGGRNESLSFNVGSKYREQHIRISSNRHVNPSQQDLDRYSREVPSNTSL